MRAAPRPWIPALVVALALVSPGADARKKRKRKAPAARPVPALTADGLPNVQSASAIVVDLDTGEELYAKDPDQVRPIASTSKIFVAMAVRGKKIPLDGQTLITEEDREWARGGARSRLVEGRAFSNHDLLRAMLIQSDNRACTALARAVGWTVDEMLAAMNGIARELGLRRTRFTHPSGLRGNVSTARELVVGLRAALEDPVIAEILATRTWRVYSIETGKRKPVAIDYFNTNHPLHGTKWDVLGGKTGFTDPAGHCLVIAARLGGRRVGMVFLGAKGELTRFADFARVAQWIVDGGPAKAAHTRKGAGALADPPPPPVTTRLAR